MYRTFSMKRARTKKQNRWCGGSGTASNIAMTQRAEPVLCPWAKKGCCRKGLQAFWDKRAKKLRVRMYVREGNFLEKIFKKWSWKMMWAKIIEDTSRSKGEDTFKSQESKTRAAPWTKQELQNLRTSGLQGSAAWRRSFQTGGWRPWSSEGSGKGMSLDVLIIV